MPMTTAKLHYPISTRTLAPDAGWRADTAPQAPPPSSDGIDPFARARRDRMIRARAGLLAVYAVIAAIVGVALFG
jgi:hypothetical protein